MAKLTRFPSRPITPEIKKLQAALAAEYQRVPFDPLDPRAALELTHKIAGDLGLKLVNHRGLLCLGPAEIDHVWGVAGNSLVIDPALPVRAPDFRQGLVEWIYGDTDNLTLRGLARQLDFDQRVFAEYPESEMAYFGAPVWGSA